MYEYVIVGAGSAGSVLAARLSEDPGSRVLLLEAGPPDTAPAMRVPARALELWGGSYAWDNTTVPQRHAANRSIPWPSGRTLGGSSSINAMMYVRGNPVDYDTWRDRFDCDGWGYADMLPYFRLAEDQQHGASPFHGAGGPLRVEDVRYKHPLAQAWVQAATAAGLPGNGDFNGASQDGVGFYQFTHRRGERWSTADAYLRPALGRGNLTVETGALVTRVSIEGERATGVRYLRNGAEREARAQAAVILCAGAVASPHLLLRSGIGPADQLRAHGIDVVVDAPAVGEGLQDHPACAVGWFTPHASNFFEEQTPEATALWQQRREGPMGSFILPAGGFGRSRDGVAVPDVQYGVMPVAASVGTDGLAIDPEVRAVTLLSIAATVASRGRVTMRSADPFTKPLIDPAYLADETDLEVLAAGVRRQAEIAACQPLASQTAGEYPPGPVPDDDQLREWVRRSVTTCFHPTSTCAMGGDAGAVCDTQLRVRGVAGLRVVDASVMPAVPRGNTNAPTIAIAERAADLIRGNKPLAAEGI